MKLIQIILVALLFVSSVKAQHLAAYNDHMERFWAFEAGQQTQLEYLEILDYQIGGLVIAYIDNGSNLKVYRNGEVETLITGNPIRYMATDYLLGYGIYEQLNVYDNGDIKVLSTEAESYLIQDSLIAWYNRISQNVQIYYDEQIYTIEDGLIYDPIKSFKLGDNTVAYIQSSTKQFKVFYHGEIFILDDFVERMVYAAGRDIVAYMDIPDQAFKVFYMGEEYILESFEPKSFKVGDGFMVYVDNLGQLKYFDGGEVVVLTTFEPSFYDVVDFTMVFEEQGFFKTYYNDQIYVIERFIPERWKIDWNTIAYLDQTRFVRAFQNGEHVMISNEIVKEFMLFRDLIVFVEGRNRVKIHFMGQVFENLF